MSKAARNEKIKLRATFLNNISVGLVLAGCLLPYLAFVQKAGDFVDWAFHHVPRETSFLDQAQIVASIVAFILAFTGARFLRREADKILEKLQD